VVAYTKIDPKYTPTMCLFVSSKKDSEDTGVGVNNANFENLSVAVGARSFKRIPVLLIGLVYGVGVVPSAWDSVRNDGVDRARNGL
jgi:hypothetical protein